MGDYTSVGSDPGRDYLRKKVPVALCEPCEQTGAKESLWDWPDAGFYRC